MALRSGHLQAFNGHLPFPQIMGIEGAGDVLATGAGVTDFRVGDAVFGFVLNGAGTYAETTVLPAANAARKPDGLSYENAAAIPVSGTSALDALDGLDLPDDATVLINGVGGSTGLVTADLARARGFTVIGTGSDAKRPVAEALRITFAALMVAGKTDAHISRSFPFDQAADAVAAVESGHITGKVIIRFAA